MNPEGQSFRGLLTSSVKRGRSCSFPIHLARSFPTSISYPMLHRQRPVARVAKFMCSCMAHRSSTLAWCRRPRMSLYSVRRRSLETRWPRFRITASGKGWISQKGNSTMYTLVVRHRPSGQARRRWFGRKSTEGFDLGAGVQNCVSCANILPPDIDPVDGHEIGHRCARFVGPVNGEPITCFDARKEDLVCGTDAVGWEPPPDLKADSVLANDVRIGAGSCIECFHFVESSDSGRTRDSLRCARYLDSSTGETTSCEAVRADVSLCGALGAWWSPREPEQDAGLLPFEATEWADVF